MPRTAGSRGKSAPKYRHHKSSGQAIVSINGKTHYLGIHDTPESKEKYQRLIAELWSPPGTPPKLSLPSVTANELTILAIAVQYAQHAKQYYQKNGKPTSEWTNARIVLKQLRNLYSSTLAVDFGPVRYQQFRQTLIDRGLARSTINHYMFHVRKMFQHAVKMELLPSDCYSRLKAVDNLKSGRSAAKETRDVLPVDPAIVDATIAELTPVLESMVRLQLLTGMRPGEVCQLRPCDIDRSNDVWTYRPTIHKNQHRLNGTARQRIIVFGPQAQKILAPYLLRDHETNCFTPLDGYLQDIQRRNENRITPMNQGTKSRFQNDDQRRKFVQHRFKPSYDTLSYRKAILRATKRAFPIPKHIRKNQSKVLQWKAKYYWTPNQLRHNAATLARKEFGLATAQQVCGHTQQTTTERHYAEPDLSLSIEFARKHG